MNLLIADDDPLFRVMLAGITRKWGFEPTVTGDGVEALKLLQQDFPPRLLLIDWEMPRLNGLELCKRVRLMPGNDPPYIILLTSRNDSSDVAIGLDAGANDYVRKPFEPVEFKARLQVGRRMLDLQTEAIAARAQLVHQAKHDALTGLPNRRAIMNAFEREIDRAGRQQIPLAVGMCDIDHFKKINDTHGHLVGDAVLHEVGQRINTTLRSYDNCGRYGGEEFLILVNSEEEEAKEVFERLRQAVSACPIIVGDVSCLVTISCGVTILGGEIRDNNTILAAADSALYEAKNNGRNRIVFLQEASLPSKSDSLDAIGHTL